MRINRRDAIIAAAAAAALSPSAAYAAYGPNHDALMAPESTYGGAPREIIPIWPEGRNNKPPGAPRNPPAQEIVQRATAYPAPGVLSDRIINHVARPVMTVFRPENPNGAALLMTPGGGYVRVVIDKEGYETAEWFAARGVTVFVLFYRLPGNPWEAGPQVSFQDAQRALRLIRSRAAEFSIDPARVALMGFSAGGHVAGSLALRWDRPVYERIDAADDLSARPDANLLIYPVITMGEDGHAGSRQQLLGDNPSDQAVAEYSLELHARADAAPTFFVHAADDHDVLSYNTMALCHALHEAGAQSEMHIFQEGGHGFALRFAVGKPVAIWPELALNWLRARNIVAAA